MIKNSCKLPTHFFLYHQKHKSSLRLTTSHNIQTYLYSGLPGYPNIWRCEFQIRTDGPGVDAVKVGWDARVEQLQSGHTHPKWSWWWLYNACRFRFKPLNSWHGWLLAYKSYTMIKWEKRKEQNSKGSFGGRDSRTQVPVANMAR